MTVTEAPRDVGDVADVETETTSPTGLAAVVGSGDPRTVGKLFVGTSLLFLLVAGVAGTLVGFEQIDLANDSNVLGSDTFRQVETLHWVVLAFGGVLPLLIGIATAVVPLQVGASTVAFPRASAAAYWGYLVSGGLLLAAYAVNGGPYGGDDGGVALFVAALAALCAALCVATVSIVTTVISLRAPGMTLRKTPLFSWSMLVAGSVWLLVLPILAGTLVLTYVDFTYGQLFLGNAAVYADTIVDRIAWVLWQPTLYSLAIPALGIVADIVPVFAQRRHHRHLVAMVLIGLFGALSFGAWVQFELVADPATADSTPWLYEGPWIVASIAIVLPLLGLLGLWTRTLQLGRVKLASPLICALAAGALLLIGVGGGAFTVVEDLDLAGTTWMTAQAFSVTAGVVVAALAALAFWGPKLYGSLLPESPVRLAATLLLLGGVVVDVAYAIAGLLDQPRWLAMDDEAIAGLDDVSTIESLNLVAAIGVTVIVVGLVFALVSALRAATSRRTPGDDPWRGHTLEWTTSSPPPVGNFASLLELTSEAPLYDARHGQSTSPSDASTEASA